MKPKMIDKVFLKDLTIDELEQIKTLANRRCYYIAEAALYAFESPAYGYWASGFPDGAWSEPRGSASRIAWERKRDQLTRQLQKYIFKWNQTQLK